MTPAALAQLRDLCARMGRHDIWSIDDIAAAREAVPALLDLVQHLTNERDNWIDTAAQGYRNADFYQGVVCQIGDTFGVAARTSDDGSIQDGVLALKVPELVAALQARASKAEAALRYIYKNGMNVDRPAWLSQALDDAFIDERNANVLAAREPEMPK